MPLVDPVTMSGTSSVLKAQTPKSSMPIELLPTPLAGLVTHLHPVLLLTTFYAGFSAFVADPVSSLAGGLAPLAIAQIAYCVICLPMAGTKARAQKKGQKAKGIPAKKGSEGLLPATKISVSADQSVEGPRWIVVTNVYSILYSLCS